MFRFWLQRILALWLPYVLSIGTAAALGRGLPPGTMLVYTTVRHRVSDNTLDHHLAVMSMDRRGLRGVLPVSYRPYQNFYGWSADGRLAFLSDRDATR